MTFSILDGGNLVAPGQIARQETRRTRDTSPMDQDGGRGDERQAEEIGTPEEAFGSDVVNELQRRGSAEQRLRMLEASLEDGVRDARTSSPAAAIAYGPGTVAERRAALKALPDDTPGLADYHRMLFLEETARRSTDPFHGVTRAMHDAATALEARAHDEELKAINERDHLAPSFATALSRQAAERGWRVAGPGDRRLGDVDAWPGVGDVDAAALAEEGWVWLELKCGAANDKLGPCVWDAAKLSVALREQRCSTAYLLAGLPEQLWTTARGAELFETRTHTIADLRANHADWWRHWERAGDPLPVHTPTRLATTATASEPLEIDGKPWLLRLAEITLTDDGETAW